jgi:uncharacterized membrane protein HdeD (DUF308 family)
MGKRSRAKRNRTPSALPRFSFSSFGLDKSTWAFVVGMFLLAYGTAAMQYSRWNHRENALVHPVFHPWAIVLGLALIVLSYTKWRQKKRP